MAVLDLAKFGFTHPKEDLSFVIDYAENAFKASSDNKRRFLEVVEIAKMYGQTKWPYKTIRNDDDEDEDEGYMDYSNYTTPSSSPTVNSDDTIDEEEAHGLVNYNTLYDCVREVVKEGNRVGYEVGLADFADIFRFKGTGILTVTGRCVRN